MEVVINWWAMLGCVVAAMAIGSLWFGPLFGKMWMGLIGLTPEGMKSMKMTVAGAMFGGAVTSFLMAYVLAHVYTFASAYTGMVGVTGGLTAAFWCWLGFAVPLTAGGFLWEGKSWKLWVLTAAYWLVTMLAMGAIIGGF